MSLKSFMLKQMLKKQMKNLPQNEQDKILNAIDKNPDFFIKIATEAKELMDKGKDQNTAMMEVMAKYGNEIRGILS